MSELRWDPLRREWTVTATHRMGRVMHPPKDFCPLCPTVPGGFASEIPRSSFQIAVFENRFPSFHQNAPEPDVLPTSLHPVMSARGACEVVVYTSDHEGNLGTLSLERVHQLIKVWQDRYKELSAREEIEYVLIFENRGAQVGVTLHHPHGQIYAFPYIPPVPARELESAAEYRREKGSCLYCDLLQLELTDGRRLIAENESFVAFIPFAARYPFEVHLYSKNHRCSLLELDEKEEELLAELLKDLVIAFDRLFGVPFPYIMVIHQEPAKGANGLGHLHFEFYPPMRDRDKLKFLAGCEQGAGTFINDSLPEEKAVLLRKVFNGLNE